MIDSHKNHSVVSVDSEWTSKKVYIYLSKKYTNIVMYQTGKVLRLLLPVVSFFLC